MGLIPLPQRVTESGLAPPGWRSQLAPQPSHVSRRCAWGPDSKSVSETKLGVQVKLCVHSTKAEFFNVPCTQNFKAVFGLGLIPSECCCLHFPSPCQPFFWLTTKLTNQQKTTGICMMLNDILGNSSPFLSSHSQNFSFFMI